jgi:hypothetical protein
MSVGKTVIDYLVAGSRGSEKGSFGMAESGAPRVGHFIEIQIEGRGTPVRVVSVYPPEMVQGAEHIRIVCSIHMVSPREKRVARTRFGQTVKSLGILTTR